MAELCPDPLGKITTPIQLAQLDFGGVSSGKGRNIKAKEKKKGGKKTVRVKGKEGMERDKIPYRTSFFHFQSSVPVQTSDDSYRGFIAVYENVILVRCRETFAVVRGQIRWRRLDDVQGLTSTSLPQPHMLLLLLVIVLER